MFSVLFMSINIRIVFGLQILYLCIHFSFACFNQCNIYGGEKTPVNRVNIRSKYMDDHGNVNPIMMSQIPCKTFSSVY